MEIILETQSLTKYFRHQWTMRRFLALDRVDLQVDAGQILGLIGPNGAGKTTTFKCILGLLRPTSGTVTFCGEPLRAAARAGIGFLPEQPYFYDYLTVCETLDLYARLYGMSGSRRTQRINDIVEQLQLGHKARSPLRTLSKGTLQRVGIAQAILNEPRLVILDEPMSGLDPSGRKFMRELIHGLRRQGTTVIFSSHILPDAEALCEKVAILTRGRVREVIDLRHERGTAAYDMAVRNVDYGILETLRDSLQAQIAANGDLHHVRLPNPAVVGRALDLVRQAGGSIESLTPIYPSLEERFLAHVGHDSKLD
jgi:ABC-2 type transport system ATP-binding protein